MALSICCGYMPRHGSPDPGASWATQAGPPSACRGARRPEVAPPGGCCAMAGARHPPASPRSSPPPPLCSCNLTLHTPRGWIGPSQSAALSGRCSLHASCCQTDINARETLYVCDCILGNPPEGPPPVAPKPAHLIQTIKVLMLLNYLNLVWWWWDITNMWDG